MKPQQGAPAELLEYKELLQGDGQVLDVRKSEERLHYWTFCICLSECVSLYLCDSVTLLQYFDIVR